MPRKDIDYSNTIIYRICCKDTSITDCYIGHTTNFINRKNGHKTACINENNKKHNYNVYQFIREKGGWDNWDMIEIEKFNATDSNDACKKERYYIELLNANLNMVIPTRTREEYFNDNKDKILEKNRNNYKDYYKNNTEKLKEYRYNNKE